MKIGLDTNVLVSAVATRGLCADLLQLILLEHDLVIGETVLSELRRVLRRKLRVPDATIDAFEAFLRRQAAIVVGDRAAIAKLDRADATVLGEAVAGSVDVLVTGDSDLLDLASAPVKVISPRGLWEQLRRAT